MVYVSRTISWQGITNNWRVIWSTQKVQSQYSLTHQLPPWIRSITLPLRWQNRTVSKLYWCTQMGSWTWTYRPNIFSLSYGMFCSLPMVKSSQTTHPDVCVHQKTPTIQNHIWLYDSPLVTYWVDITWLERILSQCYQTNACKCTRTMGIFCTNQYVLWCSSRQWPHYKMINDWHSHISPRISHFLVL